MRGQDVGTEIKAKRAYGRGYIRERGKGIYNIAISLGKDPRTGKYRYQWTTIKGIRKDAERKLRSCYMSMTPVFSFSLARFT